MRQLPTGAQLRQLSARFGKARRKARVQPQTFVLLLQHLADLKSKLDVFDDLKKVNQDLRRG